MSETESKTTTRMREVRTIGIPVRDQGKALDFYRDKLGFEKRLDAPFGHGQRWLEVAPPGGATTIALVPARDGYAAGIRGACHEPLGLRGLLKSAPINGYIQVNRALRRCARIRGGDLDLTSC